MPDAFVTAVHAFLGVPVPRQAPPAVAENLPVVEKRPLPRRPDRATSTRVSPGRMRATAW